MISEHTVLGGCDSEAGLSMVQSSFATFVFLLNLLATRKLDGRERLASLS